VSIPVRIELNFTEWNYSKILSSDNILQSYLEDLLLDEENISDKFWYGRIKFYYKVVALVVHTSIFFRICCEIGGLFTTEGLPVSRSV
jgi:hypothetical protein